MPQTKTPHEWDANGIRTSKQMLQGLSLMLDCDKERRLGFRLSACRLYQIESWPGHEQSMGGGDAFS